MGTEEDPRDLLKLFPSELLSVSPGSGNTKIIPFSKEYENELVSYFDRGCPQDEVFDAEAVRKAIESQRLPAGLWTQRASAKSGPLALPHPPRSVDRNRSLARVSEKREYFKCRPETIGDFAPKLFKFGV
jgi:hypothetical protein